VQIRNIVDQDFWIPLHQFDWRQAYPHHQAHYMAVSATVGLLLKFVWILSCLRFHPKRLVIADVAMNVVSCLVDIAAIPAVAAAVVAVRAVASGFNVQSWTPPAIVLAITLGVALGRVAADRMLLRVLFDVSVGFLWLLVLYLLNTVAVVFGLVAVYISSHSWHMQDWL